jgi:hypothetical protein
MNFLAQQLVNDHGGVTAAGTWLIIAIVVVGVLAVIVRNVIGAWADGKKLWGPKKTASEEIEEVRKQLSEHSPSSIVNPIIEKLGTFVTRDQLTALRFVDQDQMDRRMRNVDERFEKLERDLKEDINEFHEDAQEFWRTAEAQRENLHKRMNSHIEAVAYIRGRIDQVLDKKETT